MFRKLGSALAIASLLLLTNCAAFQERRLPTMDELRTAIQTACSFTVADVSLSELLRVASNIPGIPGNAVGAVAFLTTQVCNALAPKAGPAPAVPIVNGVVIVARRV